MGPRTGKPRDPAKERFWRRKMADHVRSGLTIVAFCRHERLTAGTFRWWRRELARRDCEAKADRANQAPGPSTELVVRSSFLPVRVVPDEPEPPPEMAPVEIVLPTGPTIRVPRGFDLQTLEAVLAVLEARRC